MLELISGEVGLTVIDRLNELLEAERAGVDTLSRLFPEARGPEMQMLFEGVRSDETEMKARHLTNIEACERLAKSLGAR